MRDLNQLVNAPEVELCAAAAMLQVRESEKVVDHDAVMELQNKLEVSCGHVMVDAALLDVPECLSCWAIAPVRCTIP